MTPGMAESAGGACSVCAPASATCSTSPGTMPRTRVAATANSKGRAYRDADLWHRNPRILALLGRLLRGCEGKAQIIGCGQSRVQQADDGQPHPHLR